MANLRSCHCQPLASSPNLRLHVGLLHSNSQALGAGSVFLFDTRLGLALVSRQTSCETSMWLCC